MHPCRSIELWLSTALPGHITKDMAAVRTFPKSHLTHSSYVEGGRGRGVFEAGWRLVDGPVAEGQQETQAQHVVAQLSGLFPRGRALCVRTQSLQETPACREAERQGFVMVPRRRNARGGLRTCYVVGDPSLRPQAVNARRA